VTNKKILLAKTDIDNLSGNLRGEVGEVITSWVLLRHFMAAGRALKSADGLEADMKNTRLQMAQVLEQKLNDEIVGRLSELAERKIGQLTFYFASQKLNFLSIETDAFEQYIFKSRIREKRNHDVSHKRLPGVRPESDHLRIQYRVLLKAISLALRLMKKIDRHVHGAAAPYMWRAARKKRYEFLSPPMAGYLLVPYLNLTPQERAEIVQQEVLEGKTVFTEMPTKIDGKEGRVLACKRWGVLLLGNRLLPLDRYPLVSLQELSFEPDADENGGIS
jgi:hypothetical protein